MENYESGVQLEGSSCNWNLESTELHLWIVGRVPRHQVIQTPQRHVSASVIL